MCKLCETKPVYEFTNQRKLCARCFIKYFQKKVLYTIRKFGMIKKNDVVGYENKKNFRNVVLEDVLKMFAEKAPVKLIKLNSRAKRGKLPNKIAIGQTIDLTAYKIVNNVVNNLENLNEIKPISGKLIKPLYLFLDEEVLLYAKLRKLKFIREKRKKDKISIFIDELEKKHPEVKNAIVKGFLKMND